MFDFCIDDSGCGPHNTTNDTSGYCIIFGLTTSTMSPCTRLAVTILASTNIVVAVVVVAVAVGIGVFTVAVAVAVVFCCCCVTIPQNRIGNLLLISMDS